MKEESKNMEDVRKDALRAGLWVFLMLAVLTVGEFMVGSIASAWIAVLWLVAIWKAIYVIKDYMHIGRLFSDEEND